MKKIFVSVLVITVLFCLCACNMQKRVVGEWYNAEKDDYLIIQADHSFKMKHHAGASGYDPESDYGTWEWNKDEEILVFQDSNGDIHTAAVEREGGDMVLEYYYYGKFRK